MRKIRRIVFLLPVFITLISCSQLPIEHKTIYFGYHNTTVIVTDTASSSDQLTIIQHSTTNSGTTSITTRADTTIIIHRSSDPQTTVILSENPDVVVVPVIVPWWDVYYYRWYVDDCYWWRPRRTVIIYSWYPWHPVSLICWDWWYNPWWYAHHHHHHHFSHYYGSHGLSSLHPLLHASGHGSIDDRHPPIVTYDSEIGSDVPTVPRFIARLSNKDIHTTMPEASITSSIRHPQDTKPTATGTRKISLQRDRSTEQVRSTIKPLKSPTVVPKSVSVSSASTVKAKAPQRSKGQNAKLTRQGKSPTTERGTHLRTPKDSPAKQRKATTKLTRKAQSPKTSIPKIIKIIKDAHLKPRIKPRKTNMASPKRFTSPRGVKLSKPTLSRSQSATSPRKHPAKKQRSNQQ